MSFEGEDEYRRTDYQHLHSILLKDLNGWLQSAYRNKNQIKNQRNIPLKYKFDAFGSVELYHQYETTF